MHISIGSTNGRIIAVMLLAFLAACGGQTNVVPPRDLIQGQGRIVSSVIDAGGRSYTVDEIYTPSENNLAGIAAGPDDDIWFTGDYPLVAKSSIKSDIIEYPVPTYGNAGSIVEGPDHNLWVTLDSGAIGKVLASGRLTAFPIADKFGGSRSSPDSITTGPDKDLWFAVSSSRSYIVRTDITGKMQGYRMPAGSRVQSLASGSDGNLWFTDSGSNKIGRMTATGAVKTFYVPTPNAGLSGICQGPDGKLWFLEQSANKVGSITTTGSVHEYAIPTPYSGPIGIVAGPDGALWFTEGAAGKIGRITTEGDIAELALKSSYPRPYDITVGSDKNVWFTESESYGVLGRVELHNVKDSGPKYAEISLSLGKRHAELGSPAKLRLAITAYDLANHVVKGRYPNPIHLTTSDPSQVTLSKTTVDSSSAPVRVSFSGHYTDSAISANANGGGRVDPATLLPSTPRDKKLPNPGQSLTFGPNASLWICLTNGSIATYSGRGAVKVYQATTSFDNGCSISEGADGNVWFTDGDNDRIGRMTPQGEVTFFALNHDASPRNLALGHDGALWFAENGADEIGRITTAGQVTTYKVGTSPVMTIIAGPDENLWYSEENGTIYKMSTSGKSTRVRNIYRLGGGLTSAYGNIWYYDTLNIQLDEMSKQGAILKKYSIPDYCLPFSVASGPKNSLWYVDPGNDCFARMTLSGKLSIVPTYSQQYNPLLNVTLVVGPNGDLWFNQTGSRGLGWVDPTTM
jgi:virginiamycin B lyase